MPSKSSTSKRKASVSAIENKENKAARTSNSCDAPTSRKDTVEEPIKRATRINRGQGGHVYQLEKALNPIIPITKNQRQRANEAIPENVPDNAMAPHVKAQSKNVHNSKTAPNLKRHEATLPRAGPEPVFQPALKNSRFGFSGGGGNGGHGDESDDSSSDESGSLSSDSSNDSSSDGNNYGGDNGDDFNNGNDYIGDNYNGDDYNGDDYHNGGYNNDDNVNDGGNNDDHHNVNGNLDIEIDEASPSEDEAAAQAALHPVEVQDQFLTNNEDDAIDVLEDHRTRNRAMRPPNLDILADDAAMPAMEDQSKHTQHYNRSQGSSDGSVLEVVPFDNGDDPTKPPHNLPPLTTIKAVSVLSPTDRDAYYKGYYGNQIPRPPAAQRGLGIYTAIGAIKYST